MNESNWSRTATPTSIIVDINTQELMSIVIEFLENWVREKKKREGEGGEEKERERRKRREGGREGIERKREQGGEQREGERKEREKKRGRGREGKEKEIEGSKSCVNRVRITKKCVHKKGYISAY